MSNATPTLEPSGQFPTFRNLLLHWFPQPDSWRRSIASSGLPDDIQQILSAVIKKSRLMRFEKVEVVNELINHFVDGKAAGKTDAQLIANFGDVTITASLIRNSKIRNRPIMFKILQIMGWGILALTSAYLGLWGYFQSGHPAPTTDFMPAFNEFAENIEEDDRAWPIYRPVWTKFGFCEGGGFGHKMSVLYVPDGENEYGNPKRRRVSPDDPQWEQVTVFLDENRELLDSFIEGSGKPRLGLRLQADASNYSAEDFAALFPDASRGENQRLLLADEAPAALESLIEGSLVGILLPHVQSFRSAARLLHFDILYAIEQGDSQRATQNLIAFYGLARHGADCNCLVGALVGIAVAEMGFQELENVLTNHSGFLSTEQLESVQDSIESMRPRDWIRLDGERAMVHDAIQRVFTDDGNGDGRITPSGLQLLAAVMGAREEKWSKEYPEFESVVNIAQALSAPAVVFSSDSRKETAERYDAIMDLFEEDLDVPAWEAKLHDFHQDLRQLRGMLNQHQSLLHFLPASQQLQNKLYFAQGTREAAVLALAIQRFKLDNGDWPGDVMQLTPDYLTEIPFDIFNGERLKFKVVDGAPVVYAVWHDGDDDGLSEPMLQFPTVDGRYGDPEPSHFHYFRYDKVDAWKYDGDYIMWPVLKKAY